MINTYTPTHLVNEVPQITRLQSFLPTDSVEFFGATESLAYIDKILQCKAENNRPKEKLFTALYDVSRRTFCLSRDRESLYRRATLKLKTQKAMNLQVKMCLDQIIMLSDHVKISQNESDGNTYVVAKAMLCKMVLKYYELTARQ